MSDDALDRALDRAARPLRGMSGLARILVGAAAALGVLAATAWLARLGVAGAPGWVLAAWALALGAMVLGFLMARRAIRALGPWHVAEHLEDAGAWRRGALTTVLDPPAPGPSAALHLAARAGRADEVGARADAVLAPAVERQRHRSRAAGLVAVGAAAALALAGPLRGTPARLWDPAGAWAAITAPVRVVARDSVVPRGRPATLDVTAPGHRAAVLFTRAPGEAWQERPITLDGDGRAVVETTPLAAELLVRVEAGGRASREIHIGIRLPAFLGAFTVTAHYPAYLGLESEALPVGGDTLVLPEGTRLALAGRATTPLGAARLDGPDGPAALTTDGLAFRGEIVPRLSGLRRLVATPAGGGALEGDAPVLPIRIVPDSAPQVEVPVPGADTVAAPSMRLAVVLSVSDDHGLVAAGIDARRGAKGATVRIPVPLATPGADRALLDAAIDLAALGLAAGDTLFYVAHATDNAPARHVGRSREFVVRIPTAAERRDAQEAATQRAAMAFDSLAAEAKRLQRQTEDLAKEKQRPDADKAGDGDADPLALETARKAEALAQGQEKALEDAEKLRRQVDDLERAARQQGTADSTLQGQLKELRELLDRAVSPEMRAKLDQLREALKSLDKEKTTQALQELSKEQQTFRENMEQAKELFKRAALETELAALAQDAKDLAGEQEKVTKELGKADSAGAATAQRDLAAKADSLAASLDKAAEKVPAEQTKQGLREAADRAQQAAQKMQQAAQAAQEGKRQEAQQAGQQAQTQLEQLEQQVRDERQEMQQEMKAETLRALDRLLAETSRLAERQVALTDAFRRGALPSRTRQEQALLDEGTAKLMQQVLAVSATNALISPRIGAALAAARQGMRAAIEAVSTGSPNQREATDRAGDAVDALAVAAFSLLRAKDDVGQQQSGSGVQEAMEKMQQMAQQQGQMAQQSQSMQQQGQSAMEQMMRLAMQQRSMAQQLDRMRAQGSMPGAGELAREAKELARMLEAGRLDQETVDRQQKLFRKMLDAGRALQGEEKDDTKERQSEAPKEGDPRRPPALDPRLRSGDGEIRLPSWEALQRLSPEERRRVVDYFRRLAGGDGR